MRVHTCDVLCVNAETSPAIEQLQPQLRTIVLGVLGVHSAYVLGAGLCDSPGCLP